MNRLRFLPVALALLVVSAADATTVVMATDAELVESAQAVVRGEILSVAPGRTPSGLPATEYRLRVDARLKGSVPQELTLRVLGGPTKDGHVWQVYGAPQFRPGDRALLFLMAHADGTYGPLHLAMGAFHELATTRGRLALRDLTEMEDVSSATLQEDPARDVTRFARWIEEKAAGRAAAADYRVELPAATRSGLEPQFTYIHTPPVRWFAFDVGATVHWRANVNGQDGAPGSGFDELRTAISAWNADPATNIRYQYDGTTTNSNGFLPPNGDNENTVLWNDPNGEVDGTFSCTVPGSGSGVLALGGPYATDGPPWEIVEADVITNDGAGCWFNNDGTKITQVLTHELGHTLGLGHSCGDSKSGACDTTAKNEAIMRANAHNDRRGARLGDDDLAAVFTLYPGGGGGGGGDKPATPTALAASDATVSSIKLTWVDNASNETSYRIESKTTGSFAEIATLNANTVTTVIAGLAANTTYSFRVRARNNAGPSGYSNTVTLKTLSALPSAPAKLAAAATSASTVQLSWQDKASNETGFGIEITSPSEAYHQIAVAAANASNFVVNGLVPGTPYTFRVRALAAAGSSPYSNEASATPTTPAGACVASAQALCLNGGRFRLQAQWRQPNGSHGLGTAVPSASGDQTGAFWFFDAANIELLAKVLDGSGVNGHFWVFYGALSDVQYWITVEDTLLGHSATYHNPQGSFCGAADTSALVANGAQTGRLVELPDAAARPGLVAASSAGALDACVPSPTRLCLLDGRFTAEVSFQAGSLVGDGQALPLPGGQSGLFWFFNAQNVELAVKAIDARGLNGKFWLFYGALTDVQFDLRVTDTVTGVAKTYHNVQGNLCGRGDTAAFTP